MKIRTQQDIDLLEEKIKTELGVDVRNYRNEEVAENFVALLVFPQYVIKWVLRPIGIVLILYLIGFFQFDLVHIEYLIYGLLGLGLFLIFGILLGILFLTWRIKKDILGVLDYTLFIMRSAIKDMNKLDDRIHPGNRKASMALLFKGVIHIVTIPILSTAISQKIPLAGRIINPFIKRVLRFISDRVNFEDEMMDSVMTENEDSPGWLERKSALLSTQSLGLEKLLDIAFAIARFPVLIVFAFASLILWLFITIIN